MIDIRDAFFNGIYDCMLQSKNIIILSADHSAIVLDKIAQEYPSQYINTGVSEQNMVSVAAGLALCGKKVFTYAITNFATMRCFEQINVDASSMNLDINIIGMGAGFTYSSDGPTHHGLQDMSFMSAVPNMHIYNISDSVSAHSIAALACQKQGPKYFRLGKGMFGPLYGDDYDFENGLALLEAGEDVAIISGNLMIHNALKVAENIREIGYSTAVIDLYRPKPINERYLLHLLRNTKLVITIEDHICTGGIGEKINSCIVSNGLSVAVKNLCISDKHCFQYHNNKQWMESYYGMDAESLTEESITWLKTQ